VSELKQNGWPFSTGTRTNQILFKAFLVIFTENKMFYSVLLIYENRIISFNIVNCEPILTIIHGYM